MNPLGQLAHPPAVGREIVHDVFLDRSDGVGIEDDEIRGHPRLHEPAIVDAEGRGRVERETPHGVLERHDLLLPHPVAEQAGGVADVRVELHLRAPSESPTTAYGLPRIWATASISELISPRVKTVFSSSSAARSRNASSGFLPCAFAIAA